MIGCACAHDSCVVLVIQDLNERRALQAELLESGIDAIGRESLGELLIEPPNRHEHGPIGVLLVDARVLGGARARLLALARSRYPGAWLALLTGSLMPKDFGPWDLVLRRPIAIGEVAATLQSVSQGCGA
jgi:hypothetical protein